METQSTHQKSAENTRAVRTQNTENGDSVSSSALDMQDIVMLQRQLGNRAVQRMIAQREAVPAAKNITRTPSRGAQRHIQRNIFHSMFRGYARKNIFGKNKERRNTGEDTATVKTKLKPFFKDIKDISVKSGPHNLTGRHYVGLDKATANDDGKYAGKTILFLSGSGGSAETYGLDLARYYCVRGADFIAVNYRGFGGSTVGPKNKKLDNSDITEQGVYDDAHAIFGHLQGMGIDPGSVIVHGFSLGGPVAAELVNHLAGQGIRVGGLVLHSPMDSVKQQAVNSAGGAGEFVANASGVIMDVRQHLLALSKQPGFKDLAIHFMSGKKANDDQLGFDATGVDADAGKMGFTNTSSTMSNEGGHLDTRKHIETAAKGANTYDNPANSLDRLFAVPAQVDGVQPDDAPEAEIAPIIEQLVLSVSGEAQQSEVEGAKKQEGS